MNSGPVVEETFKEFGYTSVYNDPLIHVFAAPGCRHCSIESDTKRLIDDGRKRLQTQNSVRAPALQQYYDGLVGPEERRTDDQSFFEFIKGGTQQAYPLVFHIWPEIIGKRLPELETLTSQGFGQLIQHINNLHQMVAGTQPPQAPRPF